MLVNSLIVLKRQLEVLWIWAKWCVDSGMACFRALESELLRVFWEEIGSELLLILESEDFTVVSPRGNKPDLSVFARDASVLLRRTLKAVVAPVLLSASSFLQGDRGSSFFPCTCPGVLQVLVCVPWEHMLVRLSEAYTRWPAHYCRAIKDSLEPLLLPLTVTPLVDVLLFIRLAQQQCSWPSRDAVKLIGWI